MYSVCIADDELLIQKSIGARLRSSGTPVRIAGCADNAESAISLYWDSKPDIFFVDINMPGMDGLSLVRRIREEDPSCATKFIIVTGYDDFGHLREAIQSGVMDYLKKPISTEEFNAVVASAARLIQQERKKHQWRHDGVLLYDEYLSDPPQTVDGGTFIGVYSADAAAFSAMEERARVGGMLRLAFQGIDNLRLYYRQDEQIPKNSLSRFMGGFAAESKLFFAYAYPKSEKLDALVERIDQTINRRFVFSPGIAECRGESCGSGTDTGILEYALEHGRIDDCRQALKACFDEASCKDTFCQELSPLYRKIVLLLINMYMTHRIQMPDSLRLELSLFALCRYSALGSLETGLNGMILSLARKIGAQERSGELIHEICEFLKHNYTNELTLNDLAGHFYVSPPYLSRRFREKTGLTFVEYLEDIRLDKAREYLVNSEAQIADVSEQVGYMDPAYFAKVFKRKFKISPSEYRLQNRL